MPEVYLHVSNGGVTFRVRRDPKWGPVVEIEQSQFGAVENQLSIKTTPRSLMDLAKVFVMAATADWGVPPDLEHFLNGQTSDPWDDIPRATSNEEVMGGGQLGGGRRDDEGCGLRPQSE